MHKKYECILLKFGFEKKTFIEKQYLHTVPYVNYKKTYLWNEKKIVA